MNQILALREKRAYLWEAAKKYRDAHIGSDGTVQWTWCLPEAV